MRVNWRIFMNLYSNEYKDWLKSLKSGDVVCVKKCCWYTSYSTVTVERVTKTKIVCTNKEDFRTLDGSSFSSITGKLVPYTDEIKKYLENHKLISSCYHKSTKANSIIIKIQESLSEEKNLDGIDKIYQKINDLVDDLEELLKKVGP
jgi:hypothetical protein